MELIRPYKPLLCGGASSEVVISLLQIFPAYSSDETFGDNSCQRTARIEGIIYLQGAFGRVTDRESFQNRLPEHELVSSQAFQLKISARSADFDPHVSRRKLELIRCCVRQIHPHQFVDGPSCVQIMQAGLQGEERIRQSININCR